jgi:two-component system LytT family response regulator
MTERGQIKALIVDDEPLARRKIQGLLKGDPDIQILGTCSNGREALAAMTEGAPDLVFLDVQMPEMDGFQALESLKGNPPFIIFVTAYDQYALRAFEFYALDYLLKPFDRKRFEKALRHAKERIRTEKNNELSQQTRAFFEQIKSRSENRERLVIKSGGRVFLLRSEEIDWIEAEGKYVRVHTGKQAYLMREAIGALETQLDPKRFLRIHRSAIINIDRIRELEPWFHNEYRVVLKDGTTLMLSRSFRKRLSEALGNQL